MRFLIVGLGNIGEKYLETRHNIGFEVADILNNKIGTGSYELDRYAQYSKCRYKGKIIHIIKPTTYMNNSGKSVKYWKEKWKVPLENILVVTDDIVLPFGKIRMKAKGSCGGHNGLGDIEICLHTKDYPRLRIGVGNNFSRGKQATYVLNKFNDKQQGDIPFIIDRAVNSIIAFLFEGISVAMNKYNGALE